MTQPARKKETATQLELLEAELTAARKVTARYRTAMEKAEKRHGQRRMRRRLLSTGMTVIWLPPGATRPTG